MDLKKLYKKKVSIVASTWPNFYDLSYKSLQQILGE